MNCRICSSRADSYDSAVVRGCYPADILRCSSCGFVFLAPLNWLDEAYKQAINPTDVGYVSRNLEAAEYLAQLLGLGLGPDDYTCDYGAGYGLLVRLMRDRGFRFHWHDAFCQNLFARHCEASMHDFGPYTALTAIEVFEHLADPVAEVRKMREWSDWTLFTTETVPCERPRPAEWWYFGLDHGQHISFYSPKSLEVLAESVGLVYTPLGGKWHCFSLAERVSNIAKLQQALASRWRRRKVPRRESLLAQDFQRALRLESNGSPIMVESQNLDGRLD